MTREQILDAALRLVEAGGVSQLSMRKLAADLGVSVTSIYWHVGSRDQLLDALIDRVIDEAGHRAPAGRSPRTRIASIVRGMREQVRRYPHLSELAYERGRSPAVTFPAQLALAREVTAAGLRGAAAARVLRALLFFVGGWILLEHAAPPTARALWRDVDDPSVDPALAKALRDEPDMDAEFEFALDRLLDALL